MTFTDTVTFVVEECCNCGCLFALTSDMQKRLRNKPGETFYCPRGHAQYYTGKTEEQKQRERAERLERQLANRDEDLRSARASLIATKGQLTKAKKRADAGICQHCKRSFANVSRHVAHMHPEAVSK